jgi:DNA-directed RNA polymerase subunit RPC12/RpoP
MQRFKCKNCGLFFSSPNEKELSRCTRCGTMCRAGRGLDLPVKGNKYGEEVAKQNYRCLECANEFQLNLSDSRTAMVCNRCRSTRIKPISPVAYLKKPKVMDKKAAKFAAFAKTWHENYDKLEAIFKDLEYTSTIFGMDMQQQIRDFKAEVMKKAAEVKDAKLGAK